MPVSSWSFVDVLAGYVFFVGAAMTALLILVLVAKDIVDARVAAAGADGAPRRLVAARERLRLAVIPVAAGFAVTAVARVVQVLVEAM